jgi:type I restriction enzyme S subunit
MTDWPLKPLGELFDTKPKSSDSLKQKDYLSTGKFPVVDQGQELVGGFTNNEHLVRDFGSPVVVFGDHTRCVKYVDFPFASGADGTKILVPRKGVDAKYAYFQLLSIKIPTKGYARHFGELSKLSFVLPPLDEQKRIVALLDAVTARVNECQEVTLVELRLASDLYQARIEELLSAHALKGVREVELATVIDLVIDHRGKTPNKLGGDFTDSGVPVVSAIHIKDDSIKWSERYRYVTFEMFERWMPERLMKGDILLTSEAPLGQVARIESDEPLVLSQRLFALRAKDSLVSGDYLFEFLRSPLGQDRLKARATGATAVGIRQAELMKVMVPVPRLEDQPEMIHQIHTARQTVLELKSQLRVRELLLKDLRQSILESAFAGDL